MLFNSGSYLIAMELLMRAKNSLEFMVVSLKCSGVALFTARTGIANITCIPGHEGAF
jgi:hypothetical protein